MNFHYEDKVVSLIKCHSIKMRGNGGIGSLILKLSRAGR
jgi:hypothetical protein